MDVKGRLCPFQKSCVNLCLHSMHCRWAYDRGIQTAVEQAKFDGLRGAAAKVAVQPLDSVVNVPQHCLINEITAQCSGIVRLLHSIC